MSPEQMRKELEAWYSAPSWAYKVSKMRTNRWPPC